MNEIIDDLPSKYKPTKTDFACINCPLAIWQSTQWRSIAYCQKTFKTTFDSAEDHNFEFDRCSAKNNILQEFDSNKVEFDPVNP